MNSQTRSAPLIFLIADVRGYTSFTVQNDDEAAAGLARRFESRSGGRYRPPSRAE